METHTAGARADLERLLHGALPFAEPYLLGNKTPPSRRSAVLILFGELDRVAATTSSEPGMPKIPVPAELDVLLTKRSETMRHHPGQIAFPGGGQEPQDRDLQHTALREAEEETGLDAAGVEVLGALAPVPVWVSDNLVTPVIGWWSTPSPVTVDHNETVEVLRMPVADLLAPENRGTSVLRVRNREYRAPAFQVGNAVVWGFTGVVLARLFDTLDWSVPWDRARLIPVTLGAAP